jgi:hypothetical protein
MAFRSAQQSDHCAREEFLYELKAGPAGGRLRRPPSAAGPLTGAPADLVEQLRLDRLSHDLIHRALVVLVDGQGR